MTPSRPDSPVLELLRARVLQAAPFLEERLEAQNDENNFSENRFRLQFARIRRELGEKVPELDGDAALSFRPEENEILARGKFPAAPRLPFHALARIVLIGNAVRSPAGERAPRFLHEVFTRSDAEEQRALVSSLFLLPTPESYINTALLAMSSYIHEVFGALAFHNFYPATHFPEDSFNRLVLKCLHAGIGLTDVMGLEERKNGELARMGEDFIRERTAAGRPVPEDVRLITNRA